jgi:tight adherence protein B
VRLGRSLEESMNAMADRVGSEDFRWAVLAVNIQREVGGNLAEVLDTVAETLRDRDNVRRQIDTLSSEGKLSLYILIALPILIGLYIYKFSKDYLDPLLHTTGGLLMLGSAAVFMVVGYIWMRKIVSIDV